MLFINIIFIALRIKHKMSNAINLILKGLDHDK